MTNTNKMAKKVKEIKKEELELAPEVITEDELADCIIECANGYSVIINGDYTEFVGSKNIAFNEAVKLFKIKKSI